MATLNPQTEAQALADRLKADAQDHVEARAALFFAASTLHQAAVQVTQQAEEMKAGLVLEARAAKPGAKTVAEMKAEIAAATGKHPSVITAIECVEAVTVAPKVEAQAPAKVAQAPSK